MLRNNASNSQLDEAVRTLTKHSGPTTEPAIKVYRKLVTRVLSRTFEEEGADHVVTVAALRDLMYVLANQFRSQPIDKKQQAEVLEMLMAVHYQNLLFATKALGLKEVAAKCSVTLLKYPEYVPQDKAFYQAGMCCRDNGNVNLSFLLLNRFVAALRNCCPVLSLSPL